MAGRAVGIAAEKQELYKQIIYTLISKCEASVKQGSLQLQKPVGALAIDEVGTTCEPEAEIKERPHGAY
jgi:hypothetical protein